VYELLPECGRSWRHPQPSAIEPAREIHLHVSVTSDQLAAILRH
jgi:hypothetical protein